MVYAFVPNRAPVICVFENPQCASKKPPLRKGSCRRSAANSAANTSFLIVLSFIALLLFSIAHQRFSYTFIALARQRRAFSEAFWYCTDTFIASTRPVDDDETVTRGTDKSVPYSYRFEFRQNRNMRAIDDRSNLNFIRPWANTAIIHYSSAKRLHYSLFITKILKWMINN